MTAAFHLESSYLDLPELFYTRVEPTQVTAPRLVIVNHSLAEELGVDLAQLSEEQQAELFAGCSLPEGATPFAQAYAGHQFGQFTMLGDGRAIILGEQVCPDGRRVDIQWKGSGRTAYSRGGDGRAALGPMLREYLISEAMHALGIPTTRSLAVALTGEPVYREEALQGAVLTRVASSHLRIGSFEYAAAMHGPEAVAALLDYAVWRHDPDLQDSENKALDFLERVMRRQIDLIVEWMRVGFVHGVMNTDNSTISGETIDYGPCAFMEAYDPKTVFSSIDRQGRYAFANQGQIIGWNLARLAESLLSQIDAEPQRAVDKASELLTGFGEYFRTAWLSMMGRKLGLVELSEGDEALIQDFLTKMHGAGDDYTNAFLALTEGEGPAYLPVALKQRIDAVAQARHVMRQHNPAVIPRNQRVEEALDAANRGDLHVFNALLAALQTPYVNEESKRPYQQPRPPGAEPYQTFCGT